MTFFFFAVYKVFNLVLKDMFAMSWSHAISHYRSRFSQFVAAALSLLVSLMCASGTTMRIALSMAKRSTVIQRINIGLPERLVLRKLRIIRLAVRQSAMNHSNMLIWFSRNISYYYQSLKQLCCLKFTWILILGFFNEKIKRTPFEIEILWCQFWPI